MTHRYTEEALKKICEIRTKMHPHLTKKFEGQRDQMIKKIKKEIEAEK